MALDLGSVTIPHLVLLLMNLIVRWAICAFQGQVLVEYEIKVVIP